MTKRLCQNLLFVQDLFDVFYIDKDIYQKHTKQNQKFKVHGKLLLALSML